MKCIYLHALAEISQAFEVAPAQSLTSIDTCGAPGLLHHVAVATLAMSSSQAAKQPYAIKCLEPSDIQPMLDFASF